jgi:YebC/PmpR family DNA-binding regulatory protein
VLTDKKNRTVADIRHILSKHNGNLGETGCVSWIFEKKGIFQIDSSKISEEKLLELVIEAGADDMRTEDDMFEIVTQPDSFERMKNVLNENNIEVDSAELILHPKNTVKVAGKEAEQLLKIMDALEEHDDVEYVYSNFDIDDEILQKYQ